MGPSRRFAFASPPAVPETTLSGTTLPETTLPVPVPVPVGDDRARRLRARLPVTPPSRLVARSHSVAAAAAASAAPPSVSARLTKSSPSTSSKGAMSVPPVSCGALAHAATSCAHSASPLEDTPANEGVGTPANAATATGLFDATPFETEFEPAPFPIPFPILFAFAFPPPRRRRAATPSRSAARSLASLRRAA